jgi:hypothetical protein
VDFLSKTFLTTAAPETTQSSPSQASQHTHDNDDEEEEEDDEGNIVNEYSAINRSTEQYRGSAIRVENINSER